MNLDCVFDGKVNVKETHVLKVPIKVDGREVERIKKLGNGGYISFSCFANFDDFVETTNRIMRELREEDGKFYEHIIDDKNEIYTARRVK